MDNRLLMLESQNRLLKTIVASTVGLAVIVVAMGAASFNQDRGELLKITKLQLVDDKGNEVGVIDANGIRYSNKKSLVLASNIVGRESITANAHPENVKQYAAMGISSDGRKVYLEMENNGGVRRIIFSDDGLSTSDF